MFLLGRRVDRDRRGLDRPGGEPRDRPAAGDRLGAAGELEAHRRRRSRPRCPGSGPRRRAPAAPLPLIVAGVFGSRVTLPGLTVVWRRARPCEPLVALPADTAASALETSSGSSQRCGSVMKTLSGAFSSIPWSLSAASICACARPIEDVAREEVLHVVGDRVDGRCSLWAGVAERGLHLVGDPGQGVAPQVVGLVELVLGALQVARRVERVDAGVEALGGAAVRGDLRLEAQRREVARVVEPPEEVASTAGSVWVAIAVRSEA